MSWRYVLLLFLLVVGCKDSGTHAGPHVDASEQAGRAIGEVSHSFAKGVMSPVLKDSQDTMERVQAKNREDGERRANEAALKAALPNGPRKK